MTNKKLAQTVVSALMLYNRDHIGRQLDIRDMLDIVGFIGQTLNVRRVEPFTREAAIWYRHLEENNDTTKK